MPFVRLVVRLVPLDLERRRLEVTVRGPASEAARRAWRQELGVGDEPAAPDGVGDAP